MSAPEKFSVIDGQSAPSPRISEFFVFGERHSGTNYIDALLRSNLPTLNHSANDRIGPRGFRYGWKHGFPQMLSAPQTTLAVVAFREPVRWAQAMNKLPWHAPDSLRNMGFSAFIRSEWMAMVDERNFGLLSDDDPRGLRELQWDRNPLNGARFENILRLRNAKNIGFLSLKRRFQNCIFVRYEDVADYPKGFIDLLEERFGLETLSEFTPVDTYKGRKDGPAHKPTTYPAVNKKDLGYIWSELDENIETFLGYKKGG